MSATPRNNEIGRLVSGKTMSPFTREDFEHAARAAGLVVCGRLHPPDGVNIAAPHGPVYVWRPTVDDGDALRLAVTLGMFLRCGSLCGVEHPVTIEMGNKEPDAEAVRHAIFRAAIAIGKAMTAQKGGTA